MKSNFISFTPLLAGMLLLAALAGCTKNKSDDVVIITASGNITSRVNEFRQLLGATLNTTPGATGGRREINWDGIPDSLIGKPMPQDFFNPTGDQAALAGRQRGLVYESSGVFMVSNNNFANVNSTAATDFSAFSGTRTFANISNNLWEIDPQVPGKTQAATVKGFGIVFSDVDVAGTTFIEFFSESRSLGKFFAPVHDQTSSFSFVGVYFKNEKVSSIRVGHDGTLAEGGKDISQGGTRDFVVLDDFLYDEPVQK